MDASAGWQATLRADPLDWLLEVDHPAVRHLALQQLLDRPGDDPDVVASLRAAMAADPIASILAAGPGRSLGEAWPRLCDEIPWHGLAAHLSRPTRSRPRG